MTPAHFLAAALALAVALSRPVASYPDRYQDGSHARRHPAEATDPGSAGGDDDADRQKRAYATWTDYEGFSKWKPSAYQLSRPYFIPVYGAAGKVPIYFPPQKLNLNPGVPRDNPLPNRPFVGPGYLPPTTEQPTTILIVDKFNGGDTEPFNPETEERPIWGGSVDDNENIIPTRAPKPSGSSESPPLVHDINRGTNALSVEQDVKESVSVARLSTAAPAGPSNCAWAIVMCCSASSRDAPANCFEQKGCPGPFWGASPCDSEYAKAAIASALNYYEQ